MKEKISPQVLIIGAGPTGLMMACQLAIHKIPFRIIEKNQGPTTQSRAIGVQARTLEIFRQMGIAEKAVSQGQPATAVNYLVQNAKHRIPLEGIGQGLSAFPYLLMLEQSKTEKILIEFLQSYQQKVEWNTELVSFTQNEHVVSALIKRNDKKEESVETEYIVGADGAHSAVRHQLGIPLAGATYKQSLYVLDCEVSGPFHDNEVYLSFGQETFVAFFPLVNRQWRVISALPPEIVGEKEVTFEDIQKHFSETTDIKVTLSHPNWLSVYRSHHRCVSHFRVGRSFLAGDSAHIHSPVGAQGMNTGLQDAYNLAWKLAFVLQKKAKPLLLDSYNEERLPNARKLVATTDRVFSMVIAKNILELFITRYLVPVILQIILKYRKTRNFMFRSVSQIGIHYPQSILSRNASYGSFSSLAPHPGDRVPYVADIQDIIEGKMLQIIIFPGMKERLSSQLQEFIKDYKKTMEITVIPHIEKSEIMYTAFDMHDGGFYLVRPDMYIAYRSKGFDNKHFRAYLEQFMA